MKITGTQTKAFILFLLFLVIFEGQKVYGQNFIPESTPSNLLTYNLYPYSIYPHAIVDTTIEEASPEGDTLTEEEKPKLFLIN